MEGIVIDSFFGGRSFAGVGEDGEGCRIHLECVGARDSHVKMKVGAGANTCVTAKPYESSRSYGIANINDRAVIHQMCVVSNAPIIVHYFYKVCVVRISTGKSADV